MARRDFCFVFFWIFFVCNIQAQSFDRGWYLGLVKPGDVHISMKENLLHQIDFQNTAFPAAQVGYYWLSKQLMFQVGLNNLYFAVGKSELMYNDTSQQIIQPFGGQQAININTGVAFNLDYFMKTEFDRLSGIVGLRTSSDYGIVWNEQATSLIPGYQIFYNKVNLAISLGLKHKTRTSTIIYKVNLPFFIIQSNCYRSSKPTLPADYKLKSIDNLSFKGKYFYQLGFECTLLF
jgi:hypothetical protein